MEQPNQLFVQLREWRTARAARDGVEQFRVFSNATLTEIAEVRPTTREELLRIPGIKERKFNKYGPEILRIISQASDPERANVFTVSAYLDALNHGLQKLDARIQGEVSSISERDNYLFFTLKDKRDESVLDCFMWRSDYELSGVQVAAGLEIIIYGHPEVYKKSGRLNLRTNIIELVGEGALKKAYDELKRKLELEGLFVPERKRQVPAFPVRIGLITSRTGAVIGDFLNNLGKFGFQVKFYDVHVEGQRATKDIIEALHFFQQHADGIDALVLIRGGGSLESLLAFNNESVVREVARFPKPVVCGVGHDRDIPLVSLAADIMVSTPTAVTLELNKTWEHASAKVAMAEREILSRVQSAIDQYRYNLRERGIKIEQCFAEIMGQFVDLEKAIYQRFFQLGRWIRTKDIELARTRIAVVRIMAAAVRRVTERIRYAENAVRSHDPLNRLKLGYSLMTSGGRVVRSVHGVSLGQDVDIRVADGSISSKVNRINPTKS